MDAIEASSCAEIIGAKNTIPIHTKPGELFDINIAEKFLYKNRILLKLSKEVELK